MNDTIDSLNNIRNYNQLGNTDDISHAAPLKRTFLRTVCTLASYCLQVEIVGIDCPRIAYPERDSGRGLHLKQMSFLYRLSQRNLHNHPLVPLYITNTPDEMLAHKPITRI
jgi:hypothetical protein